MQINDIIASRYVLTNLIDTGQMSEVWKARDRADHDSVLALKLLDSALDDDLLDAIFNREIGSLTRLDQPNIVTYLDSGIDSITRKYYIALEYLPGNLESHISRNGQELSTTHRLEIMESITEAVSHSHSEGVIHRDIKPSNVLISSGDVPKLTDFGISRIKDQMFVGRTVRDHYSPGYAAPEQTHLSEGDELSDIYSLGAVFYKLLTGHNPPREENLENAISRYPLNPRIQSLITNMMAADRNKRPQSAAFVLQEIQHMRNLQVVPRIHLTVDKLAIDNLSRRISIARDDTIAMLEYLVEELGGFDNSATWASKQTNNYRILGKNIILNCRANSTKTALAINTLDLETDPRMEQLRQSAAKLHYQWEPILGSEFRDFSANELKECQDDVEKLDTTLSEFADRDKNEYLQRTTSREFTELWRKVLRYQELQQRDRLERIKYRNRSGRGGTVTFELESIPSENGTWKENAPLSSSNENDYRSELGIIGSLTGKSLILVADPNNMRTERYFEGNGYEEIPNTGTLLVDNVQHSAVLRRQKRAITKFNHSELTNPRLANVLSDMTLATFGSNYQPTTFIQKNLNQTQRNAVDQALTTKDIFLIQGPPGTGKTTVITEIILQIFKDDPSARVLISSQSNVPVSHVIEALGSFGDLTSELKILRLGRTDKLTETDQAWSVETQVDDWAKQVLTQTDLVIDEIKSNQQEIKDTSQDKNDPSAPIYELIEEVEEDLNFLDLLHQEHGDRQRDLRDNGNGINPADDEIKEELVTVAREEELHQKKRAIDDLNGLIALIELDNIPQVSDKSPNEDFWEAVQSIRSELDRKESKDASNLLTRQRRLLEDWKLVVGKHDSFAKILFDRANIVGATCLYSGGKELEAKEFDWVIVDEAGRATPPEILIPLTKGKKAILVGDERQLPPYLDEDLSKDNLRISGFEADEISQVSESLFETLKLDAQASNNSALTMLDTQYRMHPAIGDLVSKVFYNGNLFNGVSKSDRVHGFPFIDSAVVWFTTSDSDQRSERRVGVTFANYFESQFIGTLLHEMQEHCFRTSSNKQIGVIAAYNGQVAQLKELIDPEDLNRWSNLDIEIATVDAFQGRDREVIIYSTVRSNNRGNVGFQSDQRRLNVALSRAKELLILVGDHKHMGDTSNMTDLNPFRDIQDQMSAQPDQYRLISTNDATFI